MCGTPGGRGRRGNRGLDRTCPNPGAPIPEADRDGVWLGTESPLRGVLYGTVFASTLMWMPIYDGFGVC